MRTTAVLVVALIAIAPLQLHGQGLTPAQVKALHDAGDEVFVRLASTPVEIDGRLAAFDAAALTMEVDGRSYTFPSAEVLRIDAMTGHKIRRGAVIGGGIAAAWCALICGQGLSEDASVPAVVLANAGLGAVIGGLIGAGHEGRKTIYKSAGPATVISRAPSELPCPATPLVFQVDLTAIDLRKLPKAWTPVAQSQGFGASPCDGLRLQRHFDGKTGVWEPGVEIAAGLPGAVEAELRVRVTVRNPAGERSKQAHVDVGLIKDGRAEVASILSIHVSSDKENSQTAVLPLRDALLSSSNLSLRVTLTTGYAR